MRIVKLIISDEFGNVTNAPEKHTYQLDLQTKGFDDIEQAVINLKTQMLPDIQKQLLIEVQEEFIKKKPDNLRCNGTASVTIFTVNGSFTLKKQRLGVK